MTGAAAQARPEGPEFFTVNQLAESLGVTARAIRFYEAKGLISPRRAGTTRVFDRRDRARLLLVLRGKRLGFSLEEIATIVDMYDAAPGEVGQLRYLLDQIAQRQRELEQRRRDIEETLGELAEVERRCLEDLHRLT
jgi:DNA-binding transcriptional MerR regulator